MARDDQAIVDRILRAGEAAIERYGLSRFTMTDVAKGAEIRRQAIYERIGSRDDLVRAIIAAKTQQMSRRICEILTSDRDIGCRVVDTMLFIVEDALAEPYMRGLASDGEFPRLTEIIGADQVTLLLAHDMWRPALQAAQDNGELIADINLDDLERWLIYIAGMLVGARAQGISDATTDGRLLATMLLPAIVPANTAA